MKISTTTAVAVAALAAAAPLSVHAQRHEDLFSMLQREFERSSALLEEMWDAAVGRFDDSRTTPSDDVRVVVVETLEDQQDVLSGDDKMLACRVAVKRVAEEAAVHDEAMELASRLRKNDVVVVNVVDETTCAMLQRPALVAECDRVMVWQKEMEMWLRRGESDVEICGALQTLEGDGGYLVLGDTDPTPLSCKLCKRFVQMVVQAIAQDVQQVQIVRDILGDICDSMAADSMCHTFLKNYDAIVDWLKHGTDPSVVCARVAMCTSEMAQIAVAVPEEKAVSVTTSKSVATAVCEGSHGCCYCVQISSVVGFISKFAPDQLDKVRSVLKFVCDKLSPSSCKCSDAEKNFDKIVELTKAGKHPKEVCQAIGLCTQKENHHEAKLTELVATSAAARKISTALLSFTTPYGVLDDNNCFYCDYFTTLLEIAIQEDEQDMEAIRQYADMICGILGDSNLCHQYVDKLDFVVDALKKGKKPREICVSLKFCTAKKHTPAIAPVAMNAVTVSAIDNCFFCTQLAGLAKVALAQDEEQIDHIRLIADLVCKALPSDNKCHLVMKEFDQIVDSLKKGEAPADICKDLKFCTKAVVPYGFPAADNCLNCEYATLFLEIFQQIDEKDVTTIRTYADIVCGMLGESSQCHQYVDKLDYILDALKKGTGPHDICKALKFCTTKSPLAINAPRVQSNAVVTPAKATVAVKIDNCFFCTQLTALFKVALAQDEEQISQIRTIADLVCDVLPATNKCHEIMKEADHIIDALKKGEEPAVICKELQFCTKAEVLPLPYMKAPVGNNDCAYCDGIATVLDFAIKEKPDQVQQIREAAGIVCDLLPADDKCHDDLKQFDKVVADLKAGKSPRAICVELNLCPKETAKLTPLSAAKLDALDAKSVVTKAEAKSMSVGCLLCEYTAEVISKIYDNQSELRLAKKTLGTMCFALPPTAKCDVITAKFDEIVHLVGDEKKSPSEACHAVGLCDAAFVEPSTPRVEGGVVEEQ